MPSLPPPLRALGRARPFHVVLVEPEIPPNTGNIARLCAATRCPLYLVGKLGFSIDEHAVRRAGLDYWHLVEVEQIPDLDTVARRLSETGSQTLPPPAHTERASDPRLWLFTSRAARSYLDVRFQPGDALVFGRESVGLPEPLLAAHAESTVAIPTLGEVRSLNLANAVAIALYEALRQTGALATR